MPFILFDYAYSKYAAKAFGKELINCEKDLIYMKCNRGEAKRNCSVFY